MSHLSWMGVDSGVSLIGSSSVGVSVTLPDPVLRASPVQLVLWLTLALFLTTNCWPLGFLLRSMGKAAFTCGTKAQCGWSMTTTSVRFMALSGTAKYFPA